MMLADGVTLPGDGARGVIGSSLSDDLLALPQRGDLAAEAVAQRTGAEERQADPALFAVDHPSLVEAYGEKFMAKLDQEGSLYKLLPEIDAALTSIYKDPNDIPALQDSLRAIQTALSAEANEQGRFVDTNLLANLKQAVELRKQESDRSSSGLNTPPMFTISPFTRLFQYLRSIEERSGVFRKTPQDEELTTLVKQIRSQLDILVNDFADSVITNRASTN